MKLKVRSNSRRFSSPKRDACKATTFDLAGFAGKRLANAK
jgi:hypothetical protein